MIESVQPTRIQELRDLDDAYAASDKGKLLKYHYRLGYLPYYCKFKQMLRAGIIPSRLAKVTPPKCATCMFDKLTKWDWRTKAATKNH